MLDAAVSYNLQDPTVWIVPAGALKQLPPWITIFLVEFSVDLWLGIIVTVTGSILFSELLKLYLIRVNNSRNLITAFHMITMFLGISQRDTKIWPLRLYLLCWAWFSLVITCSYEASLSSHLTAPTFPPHINTLKQLLESGLKLQGPIGGVRLIKGSVVNENGTVLKKI